MKRIVEKQNVKQFPKLSRHKSKLNRYQLSFVHLTLPGKFRSRSAIIITSKVKSKILLNFSFIILMDIIILGQCLFYFVVLYNYLFT